MTTRCPFWVKGGGILTPAVRVSINASGNFKAPCSSTTYVQADGKSTLPEKIEIVVYALFHQWEDKTSFWCTSYNLGTILCCVHIQMTVMVLKLLPRA